LTVPSRRFEGEVAIVTGGGRGIGEAISEALATGGATVVIGDRDITQATAVAERLAAAGAVASALSCDVSSREEVERLVDHTGTTHGKVDILVTSAGITRDNLVHKLSDDDWHGVVDTHLTGTFLCAQATQRWMVKAKRGRMVFLSSGAARGNRGQANYSAAKAGIEGLARTLSIELGRFNVTVNAVAPGFVDTRMAHDAADRSGRSWDDFRRAAEKTIPLGRIAEPADVADVVAFLCSDESRYVSGQVVNVRGGP
jgi:3-oxoacyl-[acyl-carrier protein] reductase